MKHDQDTDQAGRGFSDNRRAETRATRLYRPALVELEDFSGFCLIRNLSLHGMMGQVYTNLTPEKTIVVHFNSESSAKGTIVWSEDERVGVYFVEEIDVDEIIHELGKKHTGNLVNRPPRLPIECTGEITVDGRIFSVDVQDISQRGAKVVGTILRPGDEIVIQLDGLETHKAVVRWSRFDTAGLNFIRPLALDELAKWAIWKQSPGDVRDAGDAEPVRA